METILAFLSPLGLAWSALGIWLVLSARRRRAGELVLAAVSWTFLTLAACTPLPSLLLATLETRFPTAAVAELEAADAIVCLGGGASPSDAEPAGIHLRGSADRLATALLLARGGRAPVLVLGGGGYLIHGAWRSEAEAVTDALRQPGGTGPEILGLGLCANTRDEAVKVAQLARERGWNRVHLVTSAYHLPRAVAAFQRAGMVVQPIPCNFQTASTTGQTSRWFGAPGTAGLEHLELWLHEILGGILYRWKGWA